MRTNVRLLAGFLVIAAALAAVGVGLGRVSTDTTTASLLPVDDPSQQASIEAARSFGGDPVVVLAESREPAGLLKGDQVTRLVGLEGALSRLPDVAVVYGPGTVLNQVAGQAQNLLATIMGRRDSLRTVAESRAKVAGKTPAGVRRAVDAAVQKFDARYGSLLVKGLPAGLPTVRNPGFVRAVVFDKNGSPRQQWRFVVPRPDAVAVIVRPREGLDQAATERLVRATRLAVEDAGLETSKVTVTGMPVVAAGLGAVLREEVPVLGAIALCLIAGCYLLLPWVKRRRLRLLPLAATLAATATTLAAFGWLDHPLSLGVVAFLPIVLGTGSDFPAYLVRGAEKRRVVVTALAAAAGFASLAISPVPFVRDLGLALAAGVVLSVLFGLLLTSRRATHLLSRRSPASAVPDARRPAPAMPEAAPAVGRGTRVVTAVVAVGIALAGWFVLPRLEIQAQPERLAAGVPALADAEYAERVLGSAGEVQILVRGDDVTSTDALAWMNDVQDLVVRRFGDRLHPIASPPTMLAFLGDDPTPGQVRAGLQQLPQYLRASVIRNDGCEAVLSFGIELGDVGMQQALLTELRAAVPRPPEGISAELAGLPVVTGRSYELVSDSRYVDSLAGIAAAGVILLLGLRRKSDALRAVLAAALATGWGLAGAWLLGVALTPLTVALGSLATATACEFSVLLAGSRGSGGVLVRRAVLVAAAAATSGYLALAISDLAVIRDFGLFLAATVLLSLLAAHAVRVLAPHRLPPRHPPEPAGSSASPLNEVLV